MQGVLCLIDCVGTGTHNRREKIIEVRIPKQLNLTIENTDPGEKGNTAQGGSKPAILETGVTIQVPLFIQTGDTIRVDTKEKRYIERSKK